MTDLRTRRTAVLAAASINRNNNLTCKNAAITSQNRG